MPFLRSCPHLNNNNGSREKADKVLDGFESIATVRHILDACLGRVNARWAREKNRATLLAIHNISGIFIP